jgi:hypothetical protein
MATRAEEWDMPVAKDVEPTPTVSNHGVGQIAAAFAKAQLEMKNPGFDATNPFFKSKFASLAAVRNAVVPLLAKFNICMAQDLTTAEGTISCVTILTHASGQQMRFGPLTLPVAKDDAQGYAAAGTYAKRISLQSVCGVVGDEDDDGNSQVKAYSEPHRPQGDVGKGANPEKVEAAANAIHAALHDGDLEEKIRGLRCLDLHDALNKDQDVYVAAADRLKPSDRAAFKTFVSLAKAAEKADRAASGARF